MNQPLQTCPQCGANLTLDDLRGTNCPYCRTALPHHARAAEHAALVNQILAQKGVNYQVPYQYGAAPPPVQMGPGAINPGFQPQIPPYVGDQVQQTIRSANIIVIVSIVASLVLFVVIGAAVIIFFVGFGVMSP